MSNAKENLKSNFAHVPRPTFAELLEKLKHDGDPHQRIRILPVEDNRSMHYMNSALSLPSGSDCPHKTISDRDKNVMVNVLVVKNGIASKSAGRRRRFVSARRKKTSKLDDASYTPTLMRASLMFTSRIRDAIIQGYEKSAAKRAAWKAAYKVPTKHRRAGR